MKLTEQKLKEIIREIIKEEKLKEASSMNFGGMTTFYNKYSSPEAKKIVEGKMAMYVKELRKLEHKLIKDWMSAAKSGVIDFFDLVRGFNVGDIKRAHKYEIKFLDGLLTRDKIQNRFRSYFGGKKGKPGR
tara:strand:- start:56 stop:448 length:393 start_codon:yes stop_codon:yes gene_type:complete